MKRTLIILTDDQRERLTAAAKRQGHSRATLIRIAVEEYLLRDAAIGGELPPREYWRLGLEAPKS